MRCMQPAFQAHHKVQLPHDSHLTGVTTRWRVCTPLGQEEQGLAMTADPCSIIPDGPGRPKPAHPGLVMV